VSGVGVRLALASTDGKVIDQHFGRARRFLIVEIDDGAYTVLESREIGNCRQEGHSECNFDRILELTRDCEGIFVSHIGRAAAVYLIGKGKRVFESSAPVADVMRKVIENRLLKV
jgi:predicted Fe-Mo cluster-binding NifX family protein